MAHLKPSFIILQFVLLGSQVSDLVVAVVTVVLKIFELLRRSFEPAKDAQDLACIDTQYVPDCDCHKHWQAFVGPLVGDLRQS